MFDFGWSELLIVAAVAIIVVGPKDLPRLMRSIGQYVGKAKSMARDLQNQFNDMAHQSELEEIRKSVSDIKDANPLKDIEDSLNPLATAGEDLNTTLDNVTERESGTSEIDEDPGLVEDYDNAPDTSAASAPAEESGDASETETAAKEPETTGSGK